MERQAKNYLYERNIPQLFESLMTGLMYHKPEDPIAFLQSCLEEAKKKGGQYAWDSFVTPAKTRSRTVFTQNKPLPPIGASDGQSTREKEGKEESGKRRTGNGGVEKKREEDEGVHGVQQEDASGRSSGEVGQKAEGSGPAGEAEKEDKVEDHARPQTDAEPQSLAKRPLIFVLGGPGSGKGTQCAKIVEEFHLTHLSAGDLLREEVARGSPRGQSIQEIMKEGKLVPPEVTITLLKAAMLSQPKAVGFLIDGFPRELSQAEIFESQVCKCSLVLMFECSEDVMVERLKRRGETSGRVDDNEETIRKRLHTFTESTLPVIQHYQTLGKVRLVNADHSVDEVYREVQETMRQLLASQP